MHHADTIGGRIKALRGRHNLSQEEFAARLDISRSVLSQIEIDKIRPSVELITRITREFKADYKWLMEGDEWRNVMRMESNIPRDIMPESDEVYSMKRPLKKSLIDRIFSLEEQSEKVISPIQSFSRDKEMPLISGHAIEVYPRKEMTRPTSTGSPGSECRQTPTGSTGPLPYPTCACHPFSKRTISS